MPYEVSRQARRDVATIAGRIARERGTQSADQAIETMARSFELLGRHPMAGRDRSGDLGRGRRSLVSGHYIIVYRPVDLDVLIQRVIDGRRDYPAVVGS